MGYDKADLTFVVHYQAPGSVVSYYQQVGRRDAVSSTRTSSCCAAARTADPGLFIEQAFPDASGSSRARRADAAGEEGRTTRELMAVVNVGMGRIEAMLKILDVEGAVRRTEPLASRSRTAIGHTTPSATPRSPRCGVPSSTRWLRSAPTGAA